MAQKQPQANVRALFGALDGHRDPGAAEHRCANGLLLNQLQGLALRIDVYRWTAPAALERHGKCQVPALDLGREKLAEHDFEIEKPHRIRPGMTKLLDDFPSGAAECLRICAVNRPA